MAPSIWCNHMATIPGIMTYQDSQQLSNRYNKRSWILISIGFRIKSMNCWSIPSFVLTIEIETEQKFIAACHNLRGIHCQLVLLKIICLYRSRMSGYTVYPKKYAHGFCFAVLCCGYTLTDFPISIRLTSLALGQSNDCPSTSKATLMNMDKYFMWIQYERLRNHNKAKRNKTVCIFRGIYCIRHPVAEGIDQPLQY